MRSFQARLAAMIALMSLVSLVLVGVLVRRALDERATAERYAAIQAAAGFLNDAAGTQAIERGVGTTILGAATTPPALEARFTDLQKKGDARVAEAVAGTRALLGRMSLPEVERRLTAWEKDYEALKRARSGVTGHTLERADWVALATRNIDSEFALRNALFAPRDGREQVLHYNAVLRANVATLCEFAGRERANVGGSIAAGQPLPPALVEKLRGFRAIVDQAAAEVLALRDDPATPPVLVEAIAVFEKTFLTEYQKLREAVYAASQAGAAYPVTSVEWIDQSTRAIDTGLAISQVVGTLSAAAAAEMASTARRDLMRDAGLGALAIVVFALVMLFVDRRLVRPIRNVMAGLVDGANEVGQVSASIAEASQGLAAGVSQQAASLEETSATLATVADRSNENSDRARQTSASAEKSGDVIRQAARAMQDMQGAMDRIRASSNEISKILRSIEDVAMQTNLLAINAAIEAARAGEHGAGFAVVAEEVRALAQRAAQAAQDSERQVSQAQKTTAEGTAIVERLGAAFREIDTRGEQIQTSVRDIAAASTEQADGVGQVNLAVLEMNRVVQSNAESAEASAAASEELSAQAASLRACVTTMRALLDGGTAQDANDRAEDAGARFQPRAVTKRGGYRALHA
jgi:methyl-accepting chemotaxis protein